MTTTLTGILVADVPDDEHEAIARVQSTIDAVAAHSAYAREQFVLAAPHLDDLELDDAQVELTAINVTDDALGVALANKQPIKVHVLIDTPEEVVLPLLLVVDLVSEEARVDVITEHTGLDARGLLLALITVWGARVGYHTNDDLIEAAGEYIVPVGQLTWLTEELHLAVGISDVPIEEHVAGGYLYTLPHDIGDPATADDVRAIVEASDE